MKEQDIRPQKLLERYLQLSKEDAVQCFANEVRQPIPCVACGSSNHEDQFEKIGFAYGQFFLLQLLGRGFVPSSC